VAAAEQYHIPLFACLSAASLACMHISLKHYVTIASVSRENIGVLYDQFAEGLRSSDKDVSNKDQSAVAGELLSPSEVNKRIGPYSSLLSKYTTSKDGLDSLQVDRRIVIGAPISEIIDSERTLLRMLQASSRYYEGKYFIHIVDHDSATKDGKSWKVYLWFHADCERQQFLTGYLHAYVVSKRLQELRDQDASYDSILGTVGNYSGVGLFVHQLLSSKEWTVDEMLIETQYARLSL
jgi:hypothetical protein